MQAFGVTEPTSGTDTLSLRTTRPCGTATAMWSTARRSGPPRAEHSDLMLLLARTTPKDRSRKKRTDGLSVFLVDMREAVGHGLTIRPIRTMMNHATTEVFFDDVRIPAENLIGEEGKGFRYILDGMNSERTLIAAECIGDGRWFVDKASAYAREREVFGRPIGQNQGVQFPIARAYAPDRSSQSHGGRGGAQVRPGANHRPRGQYGQAARLGSLLGGGGGLRANLRRLRLCRRVRRGAQVPRESSLSSRPGVHQLNLELPGRTRAQDAPLLLGARVDLELNGNVALVTGASRGLGAASARALAAEGTDLFLTGREEALLADLAEELRSAGSDVLFQAADLTEPDAAQRVVAEALGHFSRIDILVNSAGSSQGGVFWEIPTRSGKTVWRSNLWAPCA